MSNIEFAIYPPKISDCHKTKSKLIDWNLWTKCHHGVWSWPWPWSWFFKVRYGIWYISAQNSPIATIQSAEYRFNAKSQMRPMGLTWAMTLILNFRGRMCWVRIYRIVAGWLEMSVYRRLVVSNIVCPPGWYNVIFSTKTIIIYILVFLLYGSVMMLRMLLMARMVLDI